MCIYLQQEDSQSIDDHSIFPGLVIGADSSRSSSTSNTSNTSNGIAGSSSGLLSGIGGSIGSIRPRAGILNLADTYGTPPRISVGPLIPMRSRASGSGSGSASGGTRGGRSLGVVRTIGNMFGNDIERSYQLQEAVTGDNIRRQLNENGAAASSAARPTSPDYDPSEESDNPIVIEDNVVIRPVQQEQLALKKTSPASTIVPTLLNNPGNNYMLDNAGIPLHIEALADMRSTAMILTKQVYLFYLFIMFQH